MLLVVLIESDAFILKAHISGDTSLDLSDVDASLPHISKLAPVQQWEGGGGVFGACLTATWYVSHTFNKVKKYKEINVMSVIVMLVRRI